MLLISAGVFPWQIDQFTPGELADLNAAVEAGAATTLEGGVT